MFPLKPMQMKDIFLCLNLKYGFALDKWGYESYFSKSKWNFIKGLLVIARGKVCYTLCKTQEKCVKMNLCLRGCFLGVVA